MFSSKKPKFKLDFSIKELSNIPHTTGYCYVEVFVQDSKSGLRAALSSWKPVGKGDDSANDPESRSVSSTSGHIHVRTSKRKIHSFKCQFNYHVSCNLRFPYKKKENMIGDKFLLLRVHYMGEKTSKFENGTELGRVELNLAEYLNFSGPVTAKYLLQDSRVNSILSFSVGLKELPSDFEFSTQLQIDDQHHTANSGSSTSQSLGQKGSDSSFKVPQFSRKAVLGGIDGVINSQSSQGSQQQSSDEDSRGTSSKRDSGKETPNEQKKESLNQKGNPRQTYDNIIMDPIVSGLYKNVLESAWDPEMQEMLKYPPEKVVEHIFKAGNDDDWREGLPIYKDLGKLLKTDTSKERDSSGLVGEEAYRDDLKSWSVSWA
ncbi:hypothetical protein FT663_01995 [Candidozyma haemuli var. vulneris]|uniref:C2 NT-type domain-containing protein n=1 Tax=Candidozyma haemuli TaxID=45357 RepID=A0A2V1AN01_9ASCO|nr:hypothetical protein CXQ85_001228 [[Candida] haemuloni]KAF3991873.1 hypothetical protein FT662_01490 [[Candida] haemuloni var. vulneris]KAF3993164.1 hypothetical protein FT663_01995 [[Candida] haemuloni var. vulneris]PVH18936.1 hypothetical protein CXQ85_001228 [[Candida] haemuloni]